MSLVVLHTYWDIDKATLAKMRMEAEGFEVSLNPLEHARMSGLVQALGGIKLQVPEHQAEKASVILKQVNTDIGEL